MISYAYTILYVEDIENSIQFYKEVLGFEQKFMTPEKDYAELISGDCTIAFAQHALAESNLSNGYTKVTKAGKPFGIELGFVVKDPAVILSKAQAFGAEILEPVKTKPWGQEVGYLKDMDGFLIEVATPMDS